MSWHEFLNHFVALLVIANPFSAMPAILRITRGDSQSERTKAAIRATLAVGLILVLNIWFGDWLLGVLGIKLPAFQVAGGIILLHLAFSMLTAEESPLKQAPNENKHTASLGAIVPLAIPIIAGPGAISNVIVSANAYPSFSDHLLLSCSAILVTLVMGIVLLFASSFERFVGQSGINLFSRIGGLILAAISIQILASGLLILFPGLAS